MPLSDIEIAQQAKMQRVTKIAEKLGIPEDDLIPYGHYKAKKPKRGKGGSTGDVGATPGKPGDVSLPEKPGNGYADKPGRGYGDLPILPEPVDQPFVRTGSQGGTPPNGQVPEPASSMLLAAALAGLVVTAKPRRHR